MRTPTAKNAPVLEYCPAVPVGPVLPDTEILDKEDHIIAPLLPVDLRKNEESGGAPVERTKLLEITEFIDNAFH